MKRKALVGKIKKRKDSVDKFSKKKTLKFVDSRNLSTKVNTDSFRHRSDCILNVARETIRCRRESRDLSRDDDDTNESGT